ncbi:hypothetical protein V3C10_04400 [[Clostridium] symbiosum]|uniref:hypothetical protein n=1 Tax=Clostridium symbiosum TaxID=1512 RepID=UPI001D080CF7|nr:hypothetical protein [[Clostridium] symbiosum]MCB6610175.1 hypothetical protein [[Clostridium] symbiosum]MCB6933511.1 hypothetical protein [[Clostridium] symbiosum]
MKKVIMYKWNAVRTGRWGWSLNEVRSDRDNIYSTPYYVEIPDGFELSESVMGKKLYFKSGDRIGYELTSRNNLKNCTPRLIGGSPVEVVKLKVVGPAE